MACQRVGGGDRTISRDAIALADIAVIDKHMVPAKGFVSQQGRGFHRQPVDVLDLNVMGLAHADAHDRNVATMGMEAGHKTGLCAGASGRDHQQLQVDVHRLDLMQDFLRAGDIAKRPDLVRSAAGD